MSFGRWTESEDQMLLDGLSLAKTYAEIAARLSRPPSSIPSRIDTLSFRAPERLAQALAARKAALGGRRARPGRPVNDMATERDSHGAGRERKSASPKERAKRICLGCRNTFDSAHAGNRLCPRCRVAADRNHSPYAP